MMQWAKVVVVMSGIALLLSTTALINIFAEEAGVKIKDSSGGRGSVAVKKPVSLSFEMIGCVNQMTCGATFLVGETISFSGSLTSADGKPLPNAEVSIIKKIPKPELVTIASGITGIDGAYDLTWNAEFSPVERALADTIKKYPREVVVFYAEYGGDDTYADKRAAKLTATVRANTIFTNINAEKRVYGPGESALIFLGFIDSNDEFVDPDSIRVLYDDQELEVEKKKTGSYAVMTPPLTVDHHQVFIVPEKGGFNIHNGFLTIQVSGFFGKV